MDMNHQKTEYENIDSSRILVVEVTEGYLLTSHDYGDTIVNLVTTAPFSVTYVDRKLVCVGKPIPFHNETYHPYDFGVRDIKSYNNQMEEYNKESRYRDFPSRPEYKDTRKTKGKIVKAYHINNTTPLISFNKEIPGYEIETNNLNHPAFSYNVWYNEHQKGWDSIPEVEWKGITEFREKAKKEEAENQPKPEAVKTKSLWNLFK